MATAPQTPQAQEQPMEPTASAPSQASPEDRWKELGLKETDKDNLLKIRSLYKQDWSPTRRTNIRKVSRAFEYTKGNQLISLDPNNTSWFDPIEEAIAHANAIGAVGGTVGVNVGQYCDNIYQMLLLSFIAALSPNVPKTRFWPGNAENEQDLATAKAASNLEAYVERVNNIKGMQKQELMHLFNGGCYFVYNRWLRDEDRAGSKKIPVFAPKPTKLFDDVYICPDCGADTPAALIQQHGIKPTCQACGAQLSESDFHEGVTADLPQQVDIKDVPNGQLVETVYGTMNVDAAPYANELRETPILDLEEEIDIAYLRASFPKAWELFKESAPPGTNSGTDEEDQSRLARKRVFETYGRNSGLGERRCTYSRCWIQPEAFNSLDKREDAERLRKAFPKGCVVMSVNGEHFLDARAERLTERWTHCATLKGLGLYAFAVGDPAMDIQDRINDNANIIHEHMDKHGSPPVLVDDEAIDTDAMNGKSMPAGTLVPIKRKNNVPLSEVVFQPKFTTDANIYSYQSTLIQLAQLITGVLPQIFGGSDPNVKTAQGQNQMLNTALGRLGLFWDNIREEHSQRAEIAVKICSTSMTEDTISVVQSPDSESGYANETIYLDQLQGEIKAYPETDQGFPMTYGEMRDRIEKMLMEAADNPVIQRIFDPPTNQKLAMMYVGPPGMQLPDDAGRSKFKQVIDRLAKEEPIEGQNPVTGEPMMLPTILPDRDFDDMELLTVVAKEWGERNFQVAETFPAGYENVRAYLRLASAFATMNAAAQAIQANAASAPAPGKPSPAGAPQ
jgi:hypothetical protein